jgi:alpha-L-rhamnosidase
LRSTSPGNIVKVGLGDWCDLGPKPPAFAQLTPAPLTGTAFYQHFNWILARTAELLDKPDDAKFFDQQAAEIRDAFNREFFNPKTGLYASGSQCANAVPLVMNLVDPEHRAAVLQAIVDDVRQHGNALTTGDVGYRYLLRALAENGRSDVIFDINNQSDKPGYGYQLKKGATSLTEQWSTTGPGGVSSQNHFMLGQINEWFFHDLAGIQPDRTGPGFKKIIIHPAIVGDLTWVKAHYDSIHGRITSEWQRDGDKLTMHVTVPPSTTATIWIPAPVADSVIESSVLASTAPGVKFRRMENKTAIFAVTSGNFSFHSIVP